VKIFLVGVNHETAGVTVRECVAAPAHELPEHLATAVGCPGVGEALLLSTCNRSELYLVSANGCEAPPPLEVFAQVHEISPDILAGHSYELEDGEAVAHIFRVAAGADSMVVGETEIMGQLRQAVDSARQAGTAGKVLSRLGDRALAVGKRARTETMIDRGCMSVASVAADLARQIFDDLSTRRILVVGAGEMGGLVARRMMDTGAREVTITSRTLSRAEALAHDIGGRAADFDEFVDELMKADIVISSTSSPHPIITVERVKAACGDGHRRPMLLVDLAVPRDVEPGVRAINDVYLYDLDDLQQFVHGTEDQRLCELPQVEAIAEQEAHEFIVWAKSQEILPLVLGWREQAEAVRADEIAQLQQAIPDLPRAADKAIHLMSKRLVRRLLEEPLERVRHLAAEGMLERDLDVIRRVFQLETETESADESDGAEGPRFSRPAEEEPDE
jgi:glutamyl-tRNA reductase